MSEIDFKELKNVAEVLVSKEGFPLGSICKNFSGQWGFKPVDLSYHGLSGETLIAIGTKVNDLNGVNEKGAG